MSRLRESIFKRARSQHGRDATAVIRAGVQIGACFEILGRGTDDVRDWHPRDIFADQGCDIDTQRTVADAAEPERRIETTPVVIDGNLRRGRHEREIRLPRADLMESSSDARMRPDRKARRADT